MIKAIIHCSDSPHGRGDTAETIHRWHKQKGWAGIGYHYVILEDGTLDSGRPEYWPGAHAKGYNNTIGICLIGTDYFTAAQYSTLEKFIKNNSYTKSNVVGHYKVNKHKTCPNFNVLDFLTRIGVK